MPAKKNPPPEVSDIVVDDDDSSGDLSSLDDDVGAGVPRNHDSFFAPDRAAKSRIALFQYASYILSTVVCLFMYANALRPRDYAPSASYEVGGAGSAPSGFEGALLGAHHALRQWLAFETQLEQHFGVFFRGSNAVHYSVQIGPHFYDSGTQGNFDEKIYQMQKSFNRAVYPSAEFGCLPNGPADRYITPAINYAFLPQSLQRAKYELLNLKKLHMDRGSVTGLRQLQRAAAVRRRLKRRKGKADTADSNSDSKSSDSNSNSKSNNGELVISHLTAEILWPENDEEGRLASTGIFPARVAVLLLKEMSSEAVWRQWLQQGAEYAQQHLLSGEAAEGDAAKNKELALLHVYVLDGENGLEDFEADETAVHRQHFHAENKHAAEQRRRRLSSQLAGSGIVKLPVPANDGMMERLHVLLKAAHSDLQVQAFVVISEAGVVPIAPVRQILSAQGVSGSRSRFEFLPDPMPMLVRKHEPNFVLSRRHAAALLANPHLWYCEAPARAYAQVPRELQQPQTLAATHGQSRIHTTAEPIWYLPFYALEQIFGPGTLAKEINSGSMETRPQLEDFVQFSRKSWSWVPMPIAGCRTAGDCCGLGECQSRGPGAPGAAGAPDVVFSRIDDAAIAASRAAAVWFVFGIGEKTKTAASGAFVNEVLLRRFRARPT